MITTKKLVTKAYASITSFLLAVFLQPPFRAMRKMGLEVLFLRRKAEKQEVFGISLTSVTSSVTNNNKFIFSLQFYNALHHTAVIVQ